MIECANQDCSKLFEKKTHNNIYCSQECCKSETNKKIIARYHKNKVLKGAVRWCENEACENKLSKYNKTNFCSSCEKDRRKKKMLEVKELFNAY